LLKAIPDLKKGFGIVLSARRTKSNPKEFRNIAVFCTSGVLTHGAPPCRGICRSLVYATALYPEDGRSRLFHNVG
jgi:hypothetical protein